MSLAIILTFTKHSSSQATFRFDHISLQIRSPMWNTMTFNDNQSRSQQPTAESHPEARYDQMFSQYKASCWGLHGHVTMQPDKLLPTINITSSSHCCNKDRGSMSLMCVYDTAWHHNHILRPPLGHNNSVHRLTPHFDLTDKGAEFLFLSQYNTFHHMSCKTSLDGHKYNFCITNIPK